MERIDLDIPNVSCAHCANLVIRSLLELEGVSLATVEQHERRVQVWFDADCISADAIRLALDRRGYPSRNVDLAMAGRRE